MPDKNDTGAKAAETTGSDQPQAMPMAWAWVYHDDPRHMLFSMSRYKFVSKMLEGAGHVLEVGCADGAFTRIVLQTVGKVTAVDIDEELIRGTQKSMTSRWSFEALRHDMLAGPVPGLFDAAFSLDVLEHIPAEHEDTFIRNILASLKPEAPLIIGMPSLPSQVFASPQSKAHHVNCKEQPVLKELLRKYFHNVFMFSMNDEVVHTGFHPLGHYYLALCSHRKEKTPC